MKKPMTQKCLAPEHYLKPEDGSPCPACPTAKEPPSGGSGRRPCSADRRRKSKALAVTTIATMLDNWMCDGYPTDNDSDDYDVEILRIEAMRFQRIADARVDQLSR